ncbi:MAG: GerMN domain-containing protein [Candidatus Komeilibacteria bacterium]|nr:GerMN domain-containing protein [Candidatus Komeilibacteria bacterium]
MNNNRTVIFLGALLAAVLIGTAIFWWISRKSDAGEVTAPSVTTVEVHFINDQISSNISCEQTHGVPREINIEAASAPEASLKALLAGPNDTERKLAYYTNINPGTGLNSLSIDQGVARVDFNESLNFGVAGSCLVTSIRAQIENTLRQFPAIETVEIMVNGRSDILQP